jgi:Trypsin-like peptidase domain
MNKPTARHAGVPVHPGEGVVPIMKELRPGELKIVGTGFWITRYGLLATAKHVIEDLQTADTSMGTAYVCHLAGADAVHLRRLRRAHLKLDSDVAVAQVDNYVEEYRDNALMNQFVTLSPRMPAEGTPLVTYAYPENRPLEFRAGGAPPTITGDYFQGGFLRYVDRPEHPLLRFPYFETSVEVRAGASGGPVFDSAGRVIGINCRGWDFRGGEFQDSPLSYMVPIAALLDLEVDVFMVPPNSWEAAQLPKLGERHEFTIRELAEYGHVRVV